jgi:hypothetical protein
MPLYIPTYFTVISASCLQESDIVFCIVTGNRKTSKGGLEFFRKIFLKFYNFFCDQKWNESGKGTFTIFFATKNGKNRERAQQPFFTDVV